MNILNKISIRNLKLNKKRTISTIIGIILSTALICAVATMATSFQHTLVQNDINKSGYYHLKLYNVTVLLLFFYEIQLFNVLPLCKNTSQEKLRRK